MSYTQEQRTANVKEFVEALRSGKYKQTFGAFEYYDLTANETCFCAVGLARMLKNKNVVDDVDVVDMTDGDFYGIDNDTWGELIRLNDGGKDFHYLANLIEAKYL